MDKGENTDNESVGGDATAPKTGIQNDKATVRLPMLLGITLAGGMLIGATFFGVQKV